MGLMLSVLCSYMGAIELVFIVRDVTHQLALHQMRLRNGERKQSDISVLQDNIKASINALETVELESVERMQDGVLYKNGYRIDNEQSVKDVAQQWDDRRKIMCVSEMNAVESTSKSIVSNGYGNHSEQMTNLNHDEPNEQNNCRPIVRDDRIERRKAFKKRHSSSSSDSIRLSREEELKMFTSLEEEEYKNSSNNPISYSNSQKTIDKSFHEKQKYDAEAWGNRKPSNYHDSELWKRERATSIVEEKEDNSPNSDPTNRLSHNKRPVNGTADKPTRKTSCENDENASDACELLVDNVDTLDAHDTQSTKTEQKCTIKRIVKSPDLKQYFNDALENQLEVDVDGMESGKSREVRSTTVHSRSDSESSHVYNKSISRDSSTTYNESNTDSEYLRPGYYRTDSSFSFIQDELDSEEYHHDHRFSMNAEALEYIRGRDDWRDYTENKYNNQYRRHSSNISISEQIDSDEYHHDRKLSDLIEIAYLDAEAIKTLPSSYDGSKVFDRYYLELQQIKTQLSNDIERNVAQKQIVLLDSNDTEVPEGYMYPLPDIILDQASDYGDDSYVAVEQLDSDYSNVSESDDDVQSVVEVTHGSYASEIITTLDDDEMIEVTLWDLNGNDDRELSSKESSVEIINFPSENVMETLVLDETKMTDEDVIPSQNFDAGKISPSVGNNFSNVKNQGTDKTTVADDESENLNSLQQSVEKVENFSNGTPSTEPSSTVEISSKTEEKSTETNNGMKLQDQSDDIGNRLLHTVQQNITLQHRSDSTKTSQSFIAQESVSSARSLGSSSHSTGEPAKNSEKPKKSLSDIDDLIKEGCMGVWFHK